MGKACLNALKKYDDSMGKYFCVKSTFGIPKIALEEVSTIKETHVGHGGHQQVQGHQKAFFIVDLI